MKGYYLVQYDPEKKALRNVSAGALGGLFTMEEFWTKQRVDAMVAWLTPVYGPVVLWTTLRGEDLFTNEDVGYTERRTAAVEQGWATWKAIREKDFWKCFVSLPRRRTYLGVSQDFKNATTTCSLLTSWRHKTNPWKRTWGRIGKTHGREKVSKKRLNWETDY